MQPKIQGPKPGSGQSDEARLAKAMAGNYSYSISALFDEAWEKTEGYKAVFWTALATTFLIFLVIAMVTAFISTYIIDRWFLAVLTKAGIMGANLVSVVSITKTTLYLFAVFFILPLFAGLWMIAVAHSTGQAIKPAMLVEYYRQQKRYWLSYLWTFFLTELGILFSVFVARNTVGLFGKGAEVIAAALLVAVWVSVSVSYFFTLPLLAELNLTTWQALEASRKAVSQHFLKVLGTLLVTMLVSIIIPAWVITLLVTSVHKVMIGFGVIFIWLLPFYSLCIGILYREIFGKKA